MDRRDVLSSLANLLATADREYLRVNDSPAKLFESIQWELRSSGALAMDEPLRFSGEALMALRSVALDPANRVTRELVEALAGMREPVAVAG